MRDYDPLCIADHNGLFCYYYDWVIRDLLNANIILAYKQCCCLLTFFIQSPLLDRSSQPLALRKLYSINSDFLGLSALVVVIVMS